MIEGECMRLDWRNELSNKLDHADLQYDQSMKELTTFKIGGNASAVLFAKDENEITTALQFCKQNDIEIFLIGNGSNLLVRDGGIEGLVIQTKKNMNRVRFEGNTVFAQAGCKLWMLAKESIDRNLSGLSFAGGIPGTVGGAVYMNAGAYGGCIADCLEKVSYIDHQNILQTIKPKPEDMQYRSTIFSKEGYFIIHAEFLLSPVTNGQAKEHFDACNLARKTKQPIEFPSAGSTFKRPEGHFAGKLIEEADCKGLTIGDAQVSILHAGFIINLGNATAKDVLSLIKEVQRRVQAQSGILLEPEIRIVGKE